MTSPRTGDLVRAQADTRDRTPVSGILDLRYIPSPGPYVQVLVADDDRAVFVDPESIEVIQRGAVPVEVLEADEPLKDDPGWRRIVDLDEARREGLLQPIRVREGGTWADMFAALDEIVAPLIAVGWQLVEKHTEESWEYGDTVAYDFERGTECIEVELYEDGSLIGWPNYEPPDDEEDPEPSEALFSLREATEAAWLAEFERLGWLREVDA